MITQPLTQLLVWAFECVVRMHSKNAEIEKGRMQLRALEMQISHRYDMAEMQASLARDLIHALIERRIEAVQSGFTALLSSYAEQARHYMQQQDQFVMASFTVTTPTANAKYLARLSKTDEELSHIRADAFLLYQEMNRVLILIGGTMPTLPPDDHNTLMLR